MFCFFFFPPLTIRILQVVVSCVAAHLDPEGGSGAKSAAMRRKARTLPDRSKEGNMGGGSSGSSDGIGGGFPLTESVLRGVVAALKDIGPSAETTLLIAAHGKGKSDGAAALVAYLKRHAPELADRVAGRTALLSTYIPRSRRVFVLAVRCPIGFTISTF